MDLKQETVFNYLINLFTDREYNQQFLKNISVLWPDFKLVVERALRELHYLKRESLTDKDYQMLLPYINLKSRVAIQVWIEKIEDYCKDREDKPATSENLLSVIERNKLYDVVRGNLNYLVVEILLDQSEFNKLLWESRGEVTTEMLEGIDF